MIKMARVQEDKCMALFRFLGVSWFVVFIVFHWNFELDRILTCLELDFFRRVRLIRCIFSAHLILLRHDLLQLVVTVLTILPHQHKNTHDENCHDDAQNDDDSYADDEHCVPPLPQVVVTVTSTTLLTSVTWRNWKTSHLCAGYPPTHITKALVATIGGWKTVMKAVLSSIVYTLCTWQIIRVLKGHHI